MSPEDLDALAERVAARLRADQARLLTRPELAARLGVCERAVRKLERRGALPPPLPVGGCVRYDWQRVLKFLEGRALVVRRKGRGARRPG